MIPCSDDLYEALSERDDDDEHCEPEAGWPLLNESRLRFGKGKREIEPGETDEVHFDFVLDSDVQIIVVYSYFKNVTKKRREIGWHATSTYDLRTPS